MQTKSYALSPLAEIDLEEIWFYTFQNWSLTQADSYYREMVVAFEELGSGTKRGQEVDVRPVYLKCPVGSHLIYFRDSGDQIEVVRVLHQMRISELPDSDFAKSRTAISVITGQFGRG